jgi:ADP-heptose:LPS heptosyltransferase
VALIDPADRPRLLVLRALGLGDLLTAVPALRALRRAFPDHETVLATPHSLAPLVELADVADRVLDTAGVASPPTAVAWSEPPPDVAVNLHGRGPQSHRLLDSLRPGRLVAFACDETGHAGPRWHDDEHEARRWCRLVSHATGLPADPLDLRLAPPEVPRPVPEAAVVHPGAAYPSRRWPVDRFAAVARALAERGLPVVVTGGSGEVALAEEVRRLAAPAPVTVLAGRTGLLDLAALVRQARLVVCGDTGVAHVATAYGTPSILLFGPTPPSRWGPVTDGPHVVLRGRSGRGWVGDPWTDRVDPALLEISVADVVAALESPALESPALLGRRRTTPSCASAPPRG